MSLQLKQINSLKELAKFTPKLLELHETLEGKWEPELTSQEFFLSLIDNFGTKEVYYFGEFINNDLAYFAALLPHSPRKTMFWLFYMNPLFRGETKDILNELKIKFKGMGYTTAYSNSTRTSSSYERWLEKYGAEKVSITYKFDLNK